MILNRETAGLMLKQFGLALYVSHPASAAHFVKIFPDTEEVYIFCTRYQGKVMGTIIPPDKLHEAQMALLLPCEKCFAAIEATAERMLVLRGVRPPVCFPDTTPSNSETGWEREE